MRMKNTVALTEKGQVKPAVRTQLADYVAKHADTIFAKAEKVDGKNAYFIPVEDADGNVIYINFDVTVSTKAPFDRAEKKRAPKAKTTPTNVEVEQHKGPEAQVRKRRRLNRWVGCILYLNAPAREHHALQFFIFPSDFQNFRPTIFFFFFFYTPLYYTIFLATCQHESVFNFLLYLKFGTAPT